MLSDILCFPIELHKFIAVLELRVATSQMQIAVYFFRATQ